MPVIPENQSPAENKETTITYKGVCRLFDDTGTEGAQWAFQDERFITPATDGKTEEYDDRGLHVLKTGDRLRIFDKNDRKNVLWEGEISLIYHDQFTQGVFGQNILSDQEGIEREVWARYFKDGNTAELTVKQHDEASNEQIS